MKAIEAIEKIKVMLGMEQEVAIDSETEVQPAETEVELAEAALVDGTIVKADSFSEGAALFVVTEEGDIPAPVGVHETTDGKMITVEEEGIIAKIEDKVEEEAEVEETEAEFDNTVSLSEEVVASITNSLTEIANKLVEMEGRITTVDEQFHAFKNEPAAPKITNNLSEVQKSENDLASARFERLIEFRNQTKK